MLRLLPLISRRRRSRTNKITTLYAGTHFTSPAPCQVLDGSEWCGSAAEQREVPRLAQRTLRAPGREFPRREPLRPSEWPWGTRHSTASQVSTLHMEPQKIRQRPAAQQLSCKVPPAVHIQRGLLRAAAACRSSPADPLWLGLAPSLRR